jgi:hypothetical protein
VALAPSLSYPIWSIPYVALEPSVTYFVTYQWLEEYQGYKGQQTKDAYELGLRLHTTIEKIFHIKQGNIKRLKHKFQPVLSYTLRPYPDEEEYASWFEPVDVLDRANVISLSLDNYLDARREDERARRLHVSVLPKATTLMRPEGRRCPVKNGSLLILCKQR